MRKQEKDDKRIIESSVDDDQEFDYLQSMEEDLIDDYLMGGLTKDQQEIFENHFLANPELKHKLVFAKGLQKYANNTAGKIQIDPVSQSRLQVLMSGARRYAGVLTIVGVIIFAAATFYGYRFIANTCMTDFSRLKQDQRSAKSSIAQNADQSSKLNSSVIARSDAAPSRPDDLKNEVRPTEIVYFLSTTKINCADDREKIALDSSTEILQLQLAVPRERKDGYDAQLQDGIGNSIFSGSGLKMGEYWFQGVALRCESRRNYCHLETMTWPSARQNSTKVPSPLVFIEWKL